MDTIVEKLTKIKLVAMDVDGTLTDGKVYYSKDGEELKAFYIRDGMGIELLHHYGLKSCIITTETSQIVTARAMKLRIDHVILGSKNKLKDLEELCKELGITINEVAFIGDDINDILVIEKVGFSACPSDAIKYVRDKVDFISSYPGGNGAVREIIELILTGQGKEIVFPEYK
ncbi:MAG: KdsC family phosphatase [Candidatus Kapaibacteriota bacterium]|jgi:YrbI family 3-deoxy-D-manno-octulosonate 8-phosphate phosphatase